MSNADSVISLADLSAAGVRLRPHEAVTIARELALQVARGDLPGVPSAHVIRLRGSGALRIEGPVAAGGRAVSRAAQLLESMLPGFDAPPELRVSGALRLVIARALGTLDLPPYRSLESFADALSRFAVPDVTVVIAELVASWSAAVAAQPEAESAEGEGAPAGMSMLAPTTGEIHSVPVRSAPEALTISDIRRARRATGLTLNDIAGKSRIPAWLLRELEWGYLRNWPGGLYGRTQLIRYARAAGLDDRVVVSTVWPLIESNAVRAGTIIPAAEPVDMAGDEVVDSRPWEEAEILPVDERVTTEAAALPRRRRARLLAALAIPALLVIGVVTALENWTPADEPVVSEVRVERGVPGRPPVAGTDPAPSSARDEPPARASSTDQPVGGAPQQPATGDRATARPAPGMPDAVAYSPAFATAGSAMFYHAEANGQSSLMRADTDSGGAILRVTSIVDDNARNFHARPSPDGSLIAFDSDREGERAVYIANADGTDVRRVSAEGFGAVPSWSPDGRTLAYVRAEEGRPAVWNLWTTNLDSGETTRVTSHRVGQPWGASWFPDGRRIAYSHETRLIVRDLFSGRERVYPSPVNGRLVRTPAVSPDGRRIIFQVRRDGTWLLDLSDGSMRKVLSDTSAEEYTWSPDGRRVAYHSRRSGTWGVWVMATR